MCTGSWVLPDSQGCRSGLSGWGGWGSSQEGRQVMNAAGTQPHAKRLLSAPDLHCALSLCQPKSKLCPLIWILGELSYSLMAVSLADSWQT